MKNMFKPMAPRKRGGGGGEGRENGSARGGGGSAEIQWSFPPSKAMSFAMIYILKSGRAG